MDHEEFAARTQAIRAWLYRTAYLYLGCEADALEAVDEAVYQALRGLKKLRQPAFFETWLMRILLNQCHRELRRRRRLAGEESLPESAGPDAYDGLPLREAVRRLPEELRQECRQRLTPELSEILRRWESALYNEKICGRI